MQVLAAVEPIREASTANRIKSLTDSLCRLLRVGAEFVSMGGPQAR